jgi:hypothetical protein
MDYWPNSDVIVLPFGQLISVTHVKYTNSDGDQSTFSASDYTVDNDSDPGRVVLNYGEEWPSFTPQTSNPIEIQYICGWYCGDVWTSKTAYAVGDLVEPTNLYFNGLVYQSGDADDSGATEPTWPTTLAGTVVDGPITWTCIGRAVPKQIRQAILLQLTDFYRMREPYIIGVTFTPRKAVESLLHPYRIYGVWR